MSYYQTHLIFGVQVPEDFNSYVGEDCGIITFEDFTTEKYLYLKDSEKILSEFDTIALPYRIPENNTEYYKFQVYNIVREFNLDISLDNIGWLLAGQIVGKNSGKENDT